MLSGKLRKAPEQLALPWRKIVSVFPCKRPQIENRLHHTIDHGLSRLGDAGQHVLTSLKIGLDAIELASKADLYFTMRAYRAFFEATL